MKQMITLAALLGGLGVYANDYAPEQLMQGRFEYTIFQAGSPDGTTLVEGWLSEGGGGGPIYNMRDVSLLEPMAEEEAFFQMDATTGDPIANWLTGRFGTTHLRMDFAAEGAAVSGNAWVRRGEEGTAWTHHAIAPEPTEGVEWRGGVIWMAGALPLEPGATFQVPWFASLSGSIADITLSVTGVDEVTVPAGTYDAYRVVVEGGQPGNVIWVDTETRAIVRVEVVGQPMTIDLVSRSEL